MYLFVLCGFTFCRDRLLNELKRSTLSDLEYKLKDPKLDISKRINRLNYLHAAVDTGDYRKVEIVLNRLNSDKKSGVRYKNSDFPNARGRDGTTALGKAIERSDDPKYAKIVELLLQNPYVNVNNVGNSKYGQTSLIIALKTGHPEFAQMMIKRYGKHNQHDKILGYKDLDLTKTQSGLKFDDTALHLAIKNGYKDVIEWLLNLLPIEYLYKPGSALKTPLHLAIECDNDALAMSLIGASADKSKTPIDDLSKQDISGNTPLHCAIIRNHENVVKELIQKIKSRSFPGLQLFSGYLSITNIKKETPLHLASANNMQEVFTALFESIYESYNYNSTIIINEFFKQDHYGCSVFARAYLGENPTNSNIALDYDNINMFIYMMEHIMHTLQTKLNRNDFYSVLREIGNRIPEEIKRLFRGYPKKHSNNNVTKHIVTINYEYAKQLETIVKQILIKY